MFEAVSLFRSTWGCIRIVNTRIISRGINSRGDHHHHHHPHTATLNTTATATNNSTTTKTLAGSAPNQTELKTAPTVAKPRKASTIMEADEELRRRLEEISGEGGASGVETEDGKSTSMKRAVRNNMFRYI